jgi:hypothetical protein
MGLCWLPIIEVTFSRCFTLFPPFKYLIYDMLKFLKRIHFSKHGGFLEGVYEIELDTKTEYEGF